MMKSNIIPSFPIHGHVHIKPGDRILIPARGANSALPAAPAAKPVAQTPAVANENSPAGSQPGSCPGDGPTTCSISNANDPISILQGEIYGPPLPSDTKQPPTIEVFARYVKSTAGLALHSYTLYTYSDGTIIIHTGFPKDGNMVTGNLKFIEAPYTKKYRSMIGDDFKEEDGPKHWRLDRFVLNSDTELNAYLEKARNVGKFINTGNNGGPFDYDICVTEKCFGANSNTVQRVLHEAMGTARWINKETLKAFNLPGIHGKFYDGPSDDLIRKLGAELQNDQP